MVATAGVAEVHAPPAFPLEVSVVVPLAQIAVVPEMVPAEIAVTVIVLVAVASAQLPEPATVYVIVAVPDEIPVINPFASIVATFVRSEVHVPPGSLEVNEVVDPAHNS
jgi:hypothetical protein